MTEIVVKIGTWFLDAYERLCMRTRSFFFCFLSLLELNKCNLTDQLTIFTNIYFRTYRKGELL